jgi:hypothetical protein
MYACIHVRIYAFNHVRGKKEHREHTQSKYTIMHVCLHACMPHVVKRNLKRPAESRVGTCIFVRKGIQVNKRVAANI